MLPEDHPFRDFKVFLAFIWAYLQLPPPTRRQLAIAHFLQHGPRRKGVEAFRGVGKSWITSVYVIWILLLDPQKNILVLSASGQRAKDFVQFTRRLINEVPELQHLRARRGQRDSALSFDVGPAQSDHAPSVKAAGITGQITGSRADEIVLDDVEIPANSATVVQREKLAELIRETDSILKPEGKVTFLGTPQTQESIYNQLKDRGYTLRIWPAKYVSEEQAAKYGAQLAPDLVLDLRKDPSLLGTSTEPTRFTDADLAERELAQGRSHFSLQFMLDTSLSDLDRFPLRLSDMPVADLDPFEGPGKLMWSNSPDRASPGLPSVGFGGDRWYDAIVPEKVEFFPYTTKALIVDPSGRGKDETGWCVLALLNARLYLLDAGGLSTGTSTESLEFLANKAAQYKVHEFVYESNFGDGMFGQIMQPILHRTHPCRIEEVKHSKQKEQRIIDTLEPVLNSHRLVVNRSVIQSDLNSGRQHGEESFLQYQLFYQLTHITRDKGSLSHDDRLDALSIGVAHFTERLGQDTAVSEEAMRRRRVQAALAEYRRKAMGLAPVQTVWSQRPIVARV